MSNKDIYLVYEKYEESEAVADIYDKKEEAKKHAEWISEEPTNLESWVEVREIRSEFTEVDNDTSIDIDIDESVVSLLGGKRMPDYDLSKSNGSEQNGGDKE